MPRISAAVVMAVLAAPALILPAAAQMPPGLSFIQPLTPPVVREVQDRLHQMGLYQGRVDGNWGPDSEAALQQFQQTHNLLVTGQMNPGTAEVLGLNPTDLLQLPAPAGGEPPQVVTMPQAGQTPPPPASGQTTQPAPIRLGPDAIRNIQTQLQKLGFYNGALDGAWGPGTQGAITRLQQNHNLPQTGRLDPATVSAMGLDPYNPGAPPH